MNANVESSRYFSASTALTGTVWAQANFYEGKTVTVLIGAKSGSLEIAGANCLAPSRASTYPASRPSSYSTCPAPLISWRPTMFSTSPSRTV